MFNFFIEFDDGNAIIKHNLTQSQAKKHYKNYNKNPANNAKSWGWEESNPYKLSQQIRAKKATKSFG